MKYLIISKFGDGTALSIQLGSEGNTTKVYVAGDDKTETDRQARHIGEGWTNRVYSLKEGLDWNPDVVICDRNNVENPAGIAYARGFATFGCTPLQVRLEKDRAFALNLAQHCGLNVPSWHEFKTPDEATNFLKKYDNKWVLKFEDGSDIPTRIVESSKDAIAFLSRVKPAKSVIVEEYIGGVGELNTEAWFSNGRLIPGSINHGQEQKRFLAGNLGPNTGCESNLSWFPQDLRVFNAIFTPELLAWLRQQRYSGPLDIASITTNEGDYSFVEFTPRFGYSAIYCYLPLLRSELGSLLFDVSRGSSSYVNTLPDYGFGLTLSIAPYPYDIAKQLIPGEEVTLPNEAEFWPMDLVKVDGVWQTTGSYNLLGYLTTTHSQAQQAVDIVMSQAKRILATNLQYRVDAGTQINPRLLRHSRSPLPSQLGIHHNSYQAIQHPMLLVS